MCEGLPYDQKSDVWSMGCVLYELMTLRKAFDGSSLPALVLNIVVRARGLLHLDNVPSPSISHTLPGLGRLTRLLRTTRLQQMYARLRLRVVTCRDVWFQDATMPSPS